MDIRALMNQFCESERYKRVATEQNISLGKLIEALREIEGNRRDDAKSKEVRLEDGRGVQDIESYRGYYSDLAIEPSEDDSTMTAFALLCRLSDAVGKTFTGYKGGDFKMEKHTPMWVSEHGTASGRAVKGVELLDGKVVILTEYVD